MPPKRTASAAAEDFDSLKARSPMHGSRSPDRSQVAELKDECTKRGLDTDGKKADLVKRLKDHESGAGKKAPGLTRPLACFLAKPRSCPRCCRARARGWFVGSLGDCMLTCGSPCQARPW